LLTWLESLDKITDEERARGKKIVPMLIEKLKQIHDVIELRKGHFNFLQSSLLVLYETDDDASLSITDSSSSTLTCTDGTDATDESSIEDCAEDDDRSASSASHSSSCSSSSSNSSSPSLSAVGASHSASASVNVARAGRVGGVARVEVRLIDFDHTHYKRAIPTASANNSRMNGLKSSNTTMTNCVPVNHLVISDPSENLPDGQSVLRPLAEEMEDVHIGDSGVQFGVSSLLRLLMKMEMEI
jgi:hypothetical protein